MDLEDKRVLTPGVREYAHRILKLIRECECKGILDYEEYVDVDYLNFVIRGLEWRLEVEDNEVLKRELGLV